MLTKEKILKEHLHGLSDDQFEEDIKRFPLVEVLPAMEEYANQDKWIKTEDQLPSIDESDSWNKLHKVSIEVFTHSEFGMRKGRYYYHSDGWSITSVTGTVSVTHWQPLPAPPKQ